MSNREAIIGKQESRYNRWIGNGSTIEAHFENRSQNVFGDVQHIEMSRFSIHDSDMNSDFWPSPRLIGNEPDNIWFTSGTDLGQPICQQTLTIEPDTIVIINQDLVPDITELDRRVMEGTYQPEGGFSAGQWEAAFNLYTKLLRYEVLRPVGSQADLWFNAQEGTTVAKIGRVYEGILSLSRYSASEQAVVNTKISACASYESLLEVKDHEIGANAENDALLLQLIHERDSLSALLADAQDDYALWVNAFRATRKATAQQILNSLDSIYTVSDYEYAARELCRIWLMMYIGDTFPSLVQAQWLSDVAHQCRYSEGVAVVWARAMLFSEEEDWSVYDDCLEEHPLKTVHSLSSSIRLYPNPSRGEVIMESIGNESISGRIVLRDIAGKRLQEWFISEEPRASLRLDKDLSAGFYLIEFINKTGVSTVLKIFIQR